MRIGDKFQMVCPFCKKLKTFTVTEHRSRNHWEGRAPSCVQPDNMMVIVNDVGKQEWPLGPGSARFLGNDCKTHQPELSLQQAIEWLHEACSMTPTKRNVEEFTQGWRG